MCKKVLVCFLLLVMTSISAADIYWWTGDSGRWDVAGSWVEMDSGNYNTKVPDAADEARIDSSYNPVVLIDSAITAEVQGLTVGFDYNGGATLTVTGGSLTVHEGRDDFWGFTVGLGKPGVVNISGGEVLCHWSNMFVGTWATGELNMAGGLLNINVQLNVSNNDMGGAAGVVHLDGGAIWAGGLDIGDNGVIDITDGILQIWGDHIALIDSYIASNKITAFGGVGTVERELSGDWTVINAATGLNTRAHSPSPNGELVLNPLDELSWENPKPYDLGDTITCDVYFGLSQFAMTKIVDKQPVEKVALDWQILTSGLDYYWRVDCYDSNGGGDDSETLTRGPVWHFVAADNIDDDMVGYWNFEDGTNASYAADVSGVDPAANASFEGGASIINDPDRGLVMSNTGSGSYADLGYDNAAKLTNPDAMTVSLWMKNDPESASGWQTLASRGDTSWGLFSYRDQSDYYIIWICHNVGTGGYPYVQLMTFAPGLGDNGWHQVAGVYNSQAGLMQIYIDGDLAASKDVVGPGRIWETTDGVSFGAEETSYPSYTHYYEGLLDDIRIYPYALHANMMEAICPPVLAGSCQSGYYMLADIDKNCTVDLVDLTQLALQWLGDYDYSSDLNRDMEIDLLDFVVFGEDWQGCNDQTVCGVPFSETSPFTHSVKTMLQTGIGWGYDPDCAIAVDAVVNHKMEEDTKFARTTWVAQGNILGSMSVMSTDGYYFYANGGADGADHMDELARGYDGSIMTVYNEPNLPYINPSSPDWTEYQQEIFDEMIDDGVMAIMPQESLSFVKSGYEQAFKDRWVLEYGTPWQGSQASAPSYFLTGQLLNNLWMDSLGSLAASVADTNVSFIYPSHDIYSNLTAGLTSPVGQTVDMSDCDGYIAQVWSGTIKWCRDGYSSSKKSFFSAALACYDHFNQLSLGTDKKMWFLVDPVEDNLTFTWAEYQDWYEDCVGAMLFLSETDSYEVMPWPERIFLEIFDYAEEDIAPLAYRQEILAVTQALQEMPLGGDWVNPAAVSEGIGVAVADSLQWQVQTNPTLQGTFGQIVPLLEEGVPVSSVVMERYQDADYLSRFDVIVVCFEKWKPTLAAMNMALSGWVNDGGSLIVLGNTGDELDNMTSFWWHGLGYDSPTHHLMALVGASVANGDYSYGSGMVYRRAVSPAGFATVSNAESTYYPLVNSALIAAGQTNGLQRPGYFLMKRGDYVIGYATDTTVSSVAGSMVDIFDADLPVLTAPSLSLGQSYLYKDVTAKLAGSQPAVLHTSGRLDYEKCDAGVLEFAVRGPLNTDAVVRLFPYNKTTSDISAFDSEDNPVTLTIVDDGATFKLEFPHDPDGVRILVD